MGHMPQWLSGGDGEETHCRSGAGPGRRDSGWVMWDPCGAEDPVELGGAGILHGCGILGAVLSHGIVHNSGSIPSYSCDYADGTNPSMRVMRG